MSKILVVGDVMLDKYIYGTSSRLCQEAPVPVVQYFDEGVNYRLGGAGNVAMNIRELGGEVVLVGMRGNDTHGVIASRIAAENGIEAKLFIRERTPTTAKVRVYANQHQVLRIDKEYTEPKSEDDAAMMLDIIGNAMRDVSAVIISDYAKGVVCRKVVSYITRMAAPAGLPVLLDPKVANAAAYDGFKFTVITPNHHEAAELADMHITGTRILLDACNTIKLKYGCRHVLVTEGDRGMTLFTSTARYTHMETEAKEVFDVAGAGDTVIAALAHFWMHGESIESAAMLANKAAGIVVGKRGTATVTRKEMGLDK